ncbi:hypothetical protein SAMN05443633_11125 [Chryseobacterium arachidis]|uniref:Uncharacterized protein n=1 Tax=Chryseobacterium arachidis TaxID=1416778 RepID=A0A1M5HPW7_9FLAO|nr:hypothetical protein SAMN05443633_11125 [Chryseobacterium arachidis]
MRNNKKMGLSQFIKDGLLNVLFLGLRAAEDSVEIVNFLWRLLKI